MTSVQTASRNIAKAIEHLREAKHELRAARSDQHIPVAVQLANLEQLFDIISDPECTPEDEEAAAMGATAAEIMGPQQLQSMKFD